MPTGEALDAIVQIEAARIGESALNRGGTAVPSAELSIRALAAFIGAGIVERQEAGVSELQQS